LANISLHHFYMRCFGDRPITDHPPGDAGIDVFPWLVWSNIRCQLKAVTNKANLDLAILPWRLDVF
jgi:hypothetical protein